MIQVAVDDLAFLAADAVLRPCNDRLEPTSPAILRLDQQGGEAFAVQRRLQSPLDVGAAVITGGGDLEAKLVIHLVIQSDTSPPGPDTVRRALVSAWQRAADWRLGKIASPLIGSGPALGVEDAAALLRDTYQARSTREFPAELVIVLERDGDRAAVEAVTGSITR